MTGYFSAFWKNQFMPNFSLFDPPKSSQAGCELLQSERPKLFHRISKDTEGPQEDQLILNRAVIPSIVFNQILSIFLSVALGFCISLYLKKISLTVNTFKPLPWNSNVNRKIPLHLTPLLPK
jgi:hypothetical protein